MKDRDYIAPWACPPGRKFTNEQGEPMAGQQLLSARNAAKQEWVRQNPELAACLVGKDYQTQFEQRRKRDGHKKATEFIKCKARASSIPARRFKFLWGPYCTKCWYFEVVDLFRRFLILGLPKILRAMAPRANIQIYIGLFVMAVSPVVYSQANPYKDRNDHHLMIGTQLAQTVVVLCGMLHANVEGNLSNWIVTVIIMLTLVPMLIVLLLFVWDPRGRLLLPQKAKDKWAEVKDMLRELVRGHMEAAEAIEVAICAVEEGDIEDPQAVVRLSSAICSSAVNFNEDTLRENVSELLAMFGVSTMHAEAVLEAAGTKLLVWCLRPILEPALL